MASYRMVLGICLLPLAFLLLSSSQVAQAGHRKIQISKLANRVLMGAQHSDPSFYNAFDPAFQNHASMDSINPVNHELDSSIPTYDKSSNYKESAGFNANPTKVSEAFNDDFNKREFSHNYKADLTTGFGASLDSAHDASHPSTYSYHYNRDNHGNFAASTLDYKPNGENFNYPSFSAPSTSSQTRYARKFPSSFEATFLNKERFYGQDSPSSNQQNLYSSPSGEKSLYTSSPNEQASYSSFASHAFDSENHSPSTMPRVSEFNGFTSHSHPVLSYDSFFNSPTVNSNVVRTSPLEHPTFPVNDHGLTYGKVQVP